MDCELNGMKIKYEDDKVWVLRETKTKPSYWFELKGYVNKITGYRRVGINKKDYQYHRVVYFLHNNKWKIHDSSTNNSIDHIDRDKLNNNIENLRVVTHQENLWNQNSKGYCFHKASGKYQARIQVDRKEKHLGLFVSEDEARQAYLNAKAIHHRIPQANPL